jgi:CheY-like chemotaxis protein
MHMTIGVLDDNAALCRVIETMLALAGHQVSAHTSPLTFTRFIQSINIDEL